jgi:hypothetical protein
MRGQLSESWELGARVGLLSVRLNLGIDPGESIGGIDCPPPASFAGGSQRPLRDQSTNSFELVEDCEK